MKCTDYYAILKKIKRHSRQELIKALEPYKGVYEFEGEDRPILAACPDHVSISEPIDVYINRVEYQNETLKIYCIGKDDGENYTLLVDEFFAGQLEYVISEILPKDGIEDVTIPFEL